jgi:hypothetical protein
MSLGGPVSSIEALHAAVESASWFERLGEYAGGGLGVPVSGASWQALSRAGVTAEFGQPPRPELEDHGLDVADWLPTSFSQDDPVRGQELEALEHRHPNPLAVREARLLVAKLALQSLRGMHDHPLLEVGPVDFTVAARSAAGFACRSAATEIVLGTPGFWCSLIPVYHGGNWPFALDSNGGLLVV